MWVKPTKKQTIFFLTTRLKIVCYACYPQNRGDPERFGNEKFSSRCVRTAALRAIQSLLESTCPYPDRPQTRTAALRAIQSLLESTPPGRGAGAGVGSGGLSHEELELSDMGSVRLNVRLNALF